MRGSLDGDVTPCVGGQRKKRFASRWSLRQLIYSSPLLARRRSQNNNNGSGSSSKHKSNGGKDATDGKLGGSSKEADRGVPYHVEIHQATSRTSVFTASTKSGEVILSMECPLCCAELTSEEFWELAGCGHRACIPCLQQYLRVQITESRVCISCPECPELIHPNEIRNIVADRTLYEKYEDFMVRRVLAVEPDTRWCPAPDCGFAVIASECASCPKLKCLRPGCDYYFCYHCKAEWHPNQTCDSARAQRSPNIRSSSVTYSQDSQHRDDIKPCPRCQVLIVKMDDGSCNHMMCAVCGAEFCWLCMKEISDLHYLSPSGCTFWGKKPWSRKKKILWQLGTLVGAPVGIALVAGITVPAMIIGIPVWVGRKLYTRYKAANKHKRNAAIIGGVVASIMISPILAGLAVGIGVPILLFYVYGVVPVSLCRSGGCGGGGSGGGASPTPSSAASSTAVDSTAAMTKEGADAPITASNAASSHTAFSFSANHSVDGVSIDAKVTNHDDEEEEVEFDRESASTVALAGSVVLHRVLGPPEMGPGERFISVSSLTESAGDDGGASTRALAGSVLNYKATGSDTCSCLTTEDCTSVRFEEATAAEKTSIGSSCSFRARCALSTTKSIKSDTLSNDSVCIDVEEKEERSTSGGSRKSHTALLRSQFFHGGEGGKGDV